MYCATTFWRNRYLNLEQQIFHLFNINNRLRYNTQLAKYLKNDDGTQYTDKCTSCTIMNVENLQRETKQHLYIDCPNAVEVINHIKEIFDIKDPIPNEEIIFFSQS